MLTKLLTIIQPIYLHLLNGNFIKTDGNDKQNFINNMNLALSETNHYLYDNMLNCPWRERLTGAWLCGISQKNSYIQKIGDLFLKSETCYAGQGLCAALVLFNSEDSINYIIKYLDFWLPKTSQQYDQTWVMANLMYLDKKNKTNIANKYIKETSLWMDYANSIDLNLPDKEYILEQTFEKMCLIYRFLNDYFIRLPTI
jgi:hypothetical protein